MSIFDILVILFIICVFCPVVAYKIMKQLKAFVVAAKDGYKHEQDK